MDILRTPDERFADLPGYPFAPHYAELRDGIRMHFVDEGPRDADPVLMLHGEPSWSYVYRKMIPVFVDAGFRAVAPDLIGFGRSDKLAERSDYTYERHVGWVHELLAALDLRRITLMCQDWGGLIGLRVAAEDPERFDRIVASNTGLPVGGQKLTDAFFAWRKFSQESPEFPVGRIVAGGCVTKLSDEVIAAYDAPFPDDSFKGGPRQFPVMVPASEDDPAVFANRAAWAVFETWEKPFLTAFSDSDPITKGGDRVLRERIPGARGRDHVTIEGAGHFVQEDKGEDLAGVVVKFALDTGARIA